MTHLSTKIDLVSNSNFNDNQHTKKQTDEERKKDMVNVFRKECREMRNDIDYIKSEVNDIKSLLHQLLENKFKNQ